MSRRETILADVDHLLHTHDQWENDRTQPDVPTESVEQAIEGAVYTCQHGDVPADCRELVDAMSKLGHEWQQYSDGHWDRQQRPMPTFWEAFRSVVIARKGAERITPNPIEQVSKLRAQGLNDLQIAKAYGERDEDGNWTGPFFGRNNVPRPDLIAQQEKHELSQPGGEQIIPDGWVHPSERHRVESAEQAAENRLRRLEERKEDAPHVEKATIEEMLHEGAFPAQIAKVKGVALEEVYDVARQCGVEPNERDGRKRHHPESEPADETCDEDATSLNDLIVEMATKDDTLGAPDIAAKLSSDLGQAVTVKKVAAVLREHKKTVKE